MTYIHFIEENLKLRALVIVPNHKTGRLQTSDLNHIYLISKSMCLPIRIYWLSCLD